MKDFILQDNSYAFKLTGFDFKFTSSNLEYIAQKLRIKLKTFLGEYFLNVEIGLPFFEQIFVKSPNIDLIGDLFKQQILEEEEVDELVSFEQEWNKTTRALTTTFTIKVKEEQTTITV